MDSGPVDEGVLEHALPEEERQFRRLADLAPVMIWRSDPCRRFVYFNRRWLDFTGRELQDEIGLGWTRNISPDDYRRCLDVFQASLMRRIPFTLEYRLRRHDGVYRSILSNGVPYFRAGSFAGFLGSCVDISEQRSADTAEAADPEERARLIRELNHRIKNSLQTSLCFSAFGLSLGNPESQEELSRMTERLSLLALVHQEVSEAAEGSDVDLCEYLRRLAEAVHAAVGNPNVTLTVACEPAVLSKRRAAAIGTVIDELITAALTQRFPEQRSGTIRVESRPLPDERIEVSVSDNGVSVAPHASAGRLSYERQLLERLTAHANGTIRHETEAGTRSVITLNPD